MEAVCDSKIEPITTRRCFKTVPTFWCLSFQSPTNKEMESKVEKHLYGINRSNFRMCSSCKENRVDSKYHQSRHHVPALTLTYLDFSFLNATLSNHSLGSIYTAIASYRRSTQQVDPYQATNYLLELSSPRNASKLLFHFDAKSKESREYSADVAAKFFYRSGIKPTQSLDRRPSKLTCLIPLNSTNSPLSLQSYDHFGSPSTESRRTPAAPIYSKACFGARVRGV